MYRDFSDNSLYNAGHRLCRSVFRAAFRYEVYGVENTPPSGALLMCNHASYLDPMFVGAGFEREVYYMARSTLFVGAFGKLIRGVNAFPVHRGRPDRAALKRTLELAHSGRLVLIFPEGTRSWDGSLGEAAMGASFLAYHAHVPVLPVYLQNTFRVLPRGQLWPRRAKVRLYIGTPLDLSDLRAQAGRAAYAEIGKRIMQAIAELRDKADLSRRNRPGHLVINRSRPGYLAAHKNPDPR